jgi:hypothetical protein
LSIFASGNISIVADIGKNLWFTVPAYTEGTGIDIAANVISHEDTSTVIDTNNNLGGTVVRNLTFDTFGHVTGHSNYNLDLRYSLLTHTHSNLTPGLGLSGLTYNGGTPTTWNLDYAGSGGNFGVSNQPARSDHTHAGGIISTSSTTFAMGTGTCFAYKETYNTGEQFVVISVAGYFASGVLMSGTEFLGTIPVDYRPDTKQAQFCTYEKTDGTHRDHVLRIYSRYDASWPGQIRVGTVGDGGTARYIYCTFTYRRS